MLRFLNTAFRSLLVAGISLGLLLLVGGGGEVSVGALAVAGVCGMIYFFWHRRRPPGFEPGSFLGKLLEGLIRLARGLAVTLIVLLVTQARGDIVNGALSVISGFGVLFYLPWFVFVRETKQEALERKQREEEERRNPKPGFWDKVGAFMASGMANQGSSSGSSARPRCPTCGGRGTVRCPLPDAGMGRNCPVCHGKEYIHCTACGGRGWLYS